MTQEEIRKLQVGNVVYIGGSIAYVDSISRLYHGGKNPHWVRFYGGHYRCFEDLKGKECLAWGTTDDPEVNKDKRLMNLEAFEGVPIPETFMKDNGVNLYGDPNAHKVYEYIHIFQNEYNKVENFKDDWVINLPDKE